MKNLKTVGGLVFVALASATSTASAALTSPVTIGFDTLGAAVSGRPNLTPAASGACPNAVPCYIESTAVFGSPEDPTPFVGGLVHVHSVNYDVLNPTNKGLEYDSDSSGIYVRIRDSSAFSFNSLLFHAPINASNPDSGPNDYWDILGYGTAINPTVTTDGTVPIATQTVANGFDSTLTIGSAFGNIKSFWIHYHGYPTTPTDPDQVLDPDTGEEISNGPLTAKVFNLAIDNVVLSAPVTAPVPIPAAAWLFASSLMGLVALGRRKKAA